MIAAIYVPEQNRERMERAARTMTPVPPVIACDVPEGWTVVAPGAVTTPHGLVETRPYRMTRWTESIERDHPRDSIVKMALRDAAHHWRTKGAAAVYFSRVVIEWAFDEDNPFHKAFGLTAYIAPKVPA